MVNPQIWQSLVRPNHIMKFLCIPLLKISCIILSYLTTCKPEIIFQVHSCSKQSTCSSSQGSAELRMSITACSETAGEAGPGLWMVTDQEQCTLLVPPAAEQNPTAPDTTWAAAGSSSPPALGSSSGSVLQPQDTTGAVPSVWAGDTDGKVRFFCAENHPPPLADCHSQ